MFTKLLILLVLPLTASAHFHKGDHIHKGGRVIWLDQQASISRKEPRGMQHGFILSENDSLGSHLVATGHHSRQTEISGELTILDGTERESYAERKALNAGGRAYFLFQAQQIDLTLLRAGQILTGHIVESTNGKYEPKNVIVKHAEFKIEKVLLNIENPFFKEE